MRTHLGFYQNFYQFISNNSIEKPNGATLVGIQIHPQTRKAFAYKNCRRHSDKSFC